MSDTLFKKLKKSNSPQATRVKEKCLMDAISVALKNMSHADANKECWLMGYAFAMECMKSTVDFLSE